MYRKTFLLSVAFLMFGGERSNVQINKTYEAFPIETVTIPSAWSSVREIVAIKTVISLTAQTCSDITENLKWQWCNDKQYIRVMNAALKQSNYHFYSNQQRLRQKSKSLTLQARWGYRLSWLPPPVSSWSFLVRRCSAHTFVMYWFTVRVCCWQFLLQMWPRTPAPRHSVPPLRGAGLLQARRVVVIPMEPTTLGHVHKWQASEDQPDQPPFWNKKQCFIFFFKFMYFFLVLWGRFLVATFFVQKFVTKSSQIFNGRNSKNDPKKW